MVGAGANEAALLRDYQHNSALDVLLFFVLSDFGERVVLSALIVFGQ